MSNTVSRNMEEQLIKLEMELASIKASLDKRTHQKRRRIICLKRGCFVTAALVSCASIAESFVHDPRATLQQFMEYGSAVTLPALDSMVTWARSDVPNKATGHTTEVLSLVGEGSQQSSFLWPLYIELRGTNNPAANTQSSQSVGATVRSLVRSAGRPWTTGFHSEMAHGREALESGNVVPTNGTSILFNGEMRSYSTGGRTIGVNLQCVYSDSASKGCEHAINIQAGSVSTAWQNGIHFDSNGTYVTGNTGINFDQSHYNLGLDLANNSLRLNSGQKVILTKDGSVFLWYNPSTSRVEIFRAGERVASF